MRHLLGVAVTMVFLALGTQSLSVPDSGMVVPLSEISVQEVEDPAQKPAQKPAQEPTPGAPVATPAAAAVEQKDVSKKAAKMEAQVKEDEVKATANVDSAQQE